MHSRRYRQAFGLKVSGYVVRNQRERHATRIVLVGAGKQVVLQPGGPSLESDNLIRLAIPDAGGVFADCLCHGRQEAHTIEQQRQGGSPQSIRCKVFRRGSIRIVRAHGHSSVALWIGGFPPWNA